MSVFFYSIAKGDTDVVIGDIYRQLKEWRHYPYDYSHCTGDVIVTDKVHRLFSWRLCIYFKMYPGVYQDERDNEYWLSVPDFLEYYEKK